MLNFGVFSKGSLRISHNVIWLYEGSSLFTTNTSVSGDGKKTEATKVTTYVYGNGLLTQQSEEEYFVFHYNNIGSTILLTDATGEAEETYSYGPYGELLSGDNTKTSYLYNGMYGVATDDNGLYYMRARYYNVSIKRFINQDIVNGSITNSQSLNKFSYVQGNPIKLTDPFGLFPCISLSGIGHAALSLLGVIPGLDFCDAINAAWYYKEGDFANGTLSMVAVTPFIGSAAATGVKWGIKAGSKATKIAETVKLGSKISGKGKSFTISGGQALEAVKNLCKNVVKTGKISWKETGKSSKLGLKVAEMGDAGASIAKNGDALKALSKGQDVAKSAAVSNSTKKVARESGKGTYLKMNLQFFGESGSKAGKTYYHVTTKEAAEQIISSGELGRRGNRWESRVFAWTKQPTKKQASIAGIGKDVQTVIRFDSNASFEPDIGNRGKSIANIVVQTTDGQRVPISVNNVEIVGFKKEWWQFWKKKSILAVTLEVR